MGKYSDTSPSRHGQTSRYYHTSDNSHHSLSSDRTPLYSSYSDRAYTSSADATAAASAASSAFLWPSFDVSAALSKRPYDALYNYSSWGPHMLGQNEAWLASDTLAKRPRLESAYNMHEYPQRPGEKDCAHYMLTRTCKFGDSCKFDHPIWVPVGGIPDWKEIVLPPIPSDFHPERPGEPDCPHFVKTQKCKFGLNCKFNHPKEKSGSENKIDVTELPQRPSEPLCSFYAKTGKCKFGATCKFHHPKDIEIASVGHDGSVRDPPNPAANTNYTNGGNAVKTLITDPASCFNSKGLPLRPDEEDCPFYMKTGSCKYAASCRYNHPDRNAINPHAALAPQSFLASTIPHLSVGLVNPATSFAPAAVLYPQRPGQSECEFYMKTGICKFETKCRFHHPLDKSAPAGKQIPEQNVKLTLAGLPRREGKGCIHPTPLPRHRMELEGVSHCPFYMKTGTCKYGATCKFDHPPPGEVMSGKEDAGTVEEAKDDGDDSGSKEE